MMMPAPIPNFTLLFTDYSLVRKLLRTSLYQILPHPLITLLRKMSRCSLPFGTGPRTTPHLYSESSAAHPDRGAEAGPSRLARKLRSAGSGEFPEEQHAWAYS